MKDVNKPGQLMSSIRNELASRRDNNLSFCRWAPNTKENCANVPKLFCLT